MRCLQDGHSRDQATQDASVPQVQLALFAQATGAPVFLEQWHALPCFAHKQALASPPQLQPVSLLHEQPARSAEHEPGRQAEDRDAPPLEQGAHSHLSTSPVSLCMGKSACYAAC